jgi:hypothetical protein
MLLWKQIQCSLLELQRGNCINTSLDLEIYRAMVPAIGIGSASRAGIACIRELNKSMADLLCESRLARCVRVKVQFSETQTGNLFTVKS